MGQRPPPLSLRPRFGWMKPHCPLCPWRVILEEHHNRHSWTLLAWPHSFLKRTHSLSPTHSLLVGSTSWVHTCELMYMNEDCQGVDMTHSPSHTFTESTGRRQKKLVQVCSPRSYEFPHFEERRWPILTSMGFFHEELSERLTVWRPDWLTFWESDRHWDGLVWHDSNVAPLSSFPWFGKDNLSWGWWQETRKWSGIIDMISLAFLCQPCWSCYWRMRDASAPKMASRQT